MAGVGWRNMFNARTTLFFAAAAVCAPACFSQVPAPNAAGVSMGHLHLNSSDPDTQKTFWTEVIGARAARIGNLDLYVMPGTLIFVTKKPQKPEPTEGSVV